MIHRTNLKTVDPKLEDIGVLESEWVEGFILLQFVSSWFGVDGNTIVNTPAGDIQISDSIEDFTITMHEFYSNV